MQATRLLSGRGRVLVGVGGCRHRRGGFLQAKSQLGRSSYHVYLAFSGQSGQLNVRAGCLDGFIRRQEASSVDQAEKGRNKEDQSSGVRALGSPLRRKKLRTTHFSLKQV